MKKVLLVLIAMGNILYANAATYDTNKVNAEIQRCGRESSSTCFKTLLYKYKLNEIRYNYALALKSEKNYKAAKTEFENIIRNERKNKLLVSQAESQIAHIESLENTMKKLDRLDTGNYLSSITSVAKWQNPSSIKVFVKGNTGKEHILNKAFQIWDDNQRRVNFSIVHNEKNADIVCYYVDNLSGSEAGVAKSQLRKYSSGEVYFHKVYIEISRRKPGTTGYYNDDALLSIMLHEIGHAIGIQGHSSNKNDVMYPTTETYQHKTLSQRDINTIKELYK